MVVSLHGDPRDFSVGFGSAHGESNCSQVGSWAPDWWLGTADLFSPGRCFGFAGWTVLRLLGMRFRMRIQDHRVTGVYERPRLNASARSSNSSTSRAGGGTFVVSFSDFGGQISCVCGIPFFVIRILGWIQTTLNMLWHMAGRMMEQRMSGTLNCGGAGWDTQT